MNRQTHTYATLEVPAALLTAIATLIQQADPQQLQQRTNDKGELDMTGIALVAGQVPLHHADDTFVDLFAAAMKDKLHRARERGRDGWNDPDRCEVHYLAELLLEQLRKPEADPVDVANFAMFLHHRAGGVDALRATIAQAQGHRAQD